MKKRIISAALALCVCVSAAQAGTLISYADTSFDDGDFRYTLTGVDTVMVSKYYGVSKELELPERINNRLVTGVYSSCFENSDLEKVTIPRAYASIGSFAFNGSSGLYEVNLPSSLQTIGTMAFYGCESLQSVDLSYADELTTIGFAAFSGCSELQSVSFPDSGFSFGDNAFSRCGLTSLVIPEGVTSLPDYSFAENTALQSVTIPRSCEAVSDTAFSGCENLTIYCYENSAAHAFAAEKGIPFVLLSEVKLGDVNGDGNINITDVTDIQRHIAKLKLLEGDFLRAADVNGDETINITDATAVQKYIAKYDLPYPIGEPITAI